MLDTNGKQNLQMQTRWNTYWKYAMYKDIPDNVLEELNHEPDVLDLPKEQDWIDNYYMYQPDAKDVFSRDFAPTYGSWNIKIIEKLKAFYESIKILVQQKPALGHALQHIGKYFCAYDHGKRRGKPILCTIFKNGQLSHYELYPSIAKARKYRSCKIIMTKCTNGKPVSFSSGKDICLIYFKEESKPLVTAKMWEEIVLKKFLNNVRCQLLVEPRFRYFKLEMEQELRQAN